MTSATPTRTPAPTAVTPPRPAPVKAFGTLGALVLGLFGYVLIRWMTSPAFTRSPVGTDPIPHWLLVLIRVTEVFCAGLILVFLWVLLIKPWIRDRRAPWDGLLMLALFTMWVQDPMCNYFNFTFSYNAYFTNLGSWASFLPGWQSPRGSNLPEPIFLMGGIYLWFTTMNVLAFSWSMRKLRTWLPRMSTLGHVPIAYVTIVLMDFALELPACRLGLFAYPGAPHELTLWAGQYYQFPIYENIFMNFNYLSIGLLRFFRDDRGESLAERGIGTLAIPAKARTFVRFLALVGFCNLSYFVVYFLPYNWMANQADTFPRYPSYMRYEICGHGTPYACPSREVPVPSRGTLAPVGPDDPRLSDTARQN